MVVCGNINLTALTANHVRSNGNKRKGEGKKTILYLCY